jgi:hypothetical protein
LAREKDIQIGKEELKLSQAANDVIFYIGNSKESMGVGGDP